MLDALRSVASQSYKNIQLIIVDDASSDNSKGIIAGFVSSHSATEFIAHQTNVGICKAFNSGFAHARGEFVIDFAADDILLPERVEEGVAQLLDARQDFGVAFGDAILIDEVGQSIGKHSDRFPHNTIPSGDIYEQLIRRYFVNGPSTMVRRQVLDELHGYDENLLYEDFDFWIRSSRITRYSYTDKALVKHRVVRGGLHEKQFSRGSGHAWSTLAVCRKILSLNRNQLEQQALSSRIRYEIRQSIFRAEFKLAFQYYRLLQENGQRNYAN